MSSTHPSHPLPALRRLGAVSLAAATVLCLVPTGAASAAPRSATPAAGASSITAPTRLPVPSRAARAAGVEPGNAPMGWRQHAAATAAPAPRSGPATTAAAKAYVPSGVLGIDVASYQRTVNWTRYAAAGKDFAYVKATEGTSYKNPYFRSQYDGSRKAGLIRGAYHFASPSGSSGKKQAQFFVSHGGGWTADGRTLPGVLDIEYNPYGSTCYGLSKKAMVSWVNSFVDEYERLTGRDAVIYTTTDWWTRCTGNSTKFSRTNPLWAARYGTRDPGKLPGSWGWATFWQYSASPVDQDRFSSKYSRLVVLATDAG